MQNERSVPAHVQCRNLTLHATDSLMTEMSKNNI